MKFPRFATVALLTGALMVACGDDDDAVTPTAVITPTAPAPIIGTVSGTVSVEGSGLAEVSVNLTGPAAQSATTGSSGGYSFSNVPAGAHNVQISGTPPDVAFVSTSTGVTITTNGQTATADFTGNYIRTSDISGTVVTAGGEGVVATVTATGKSMLMDEDPTAGTSNTDGDFTLSGLRAGGYTVTISDFGDHEFTVTSREVTVGVGQSGSVAFAAEAVPEPEVTTGSITGQVVTAAGVGIVATVTAVGTGEDAVPVAGSSDTEGDYEFPEVEAGDYTVTISDFGDHEFAVTSREVTVVAGQSANASFAAEAVPEPEVTTGSITGQVVTATRVGIVATVTAVGTGEGAVPVTGNSDAEGDYEFPEVEAGDYTVTISDFGDHEFAATSREVTVVAGQSANASFVAEAETAAASILITDVSSDSDDDTYSGQVTVLIDVERGDARLEKITLYVDSDPVDSQSFGFAPAPAEDPELAAQQLVFRLSFDSDEYDPERETPATYENGPHNIVAAVKVQGSTEEALSNRMEVEFDNEDGVHVTVSDRTAVIGQDGGYWYGGPDAGFDLTVVPVMYSGSTVISVTLRKGFCGSDAASDTEAPYVLTPDCAGFEGSVAEAVAEGFISIGTAPVQTLNAEDESFSIQLDYAGPDAPFFMPNPNGRQAGWINDAVGLVAKHDVEKNPDGWLAYGKAGGGVGGYTVQLQVGKDMEEALAATASSTPALPAAMAKNDAYCFVASAVDDLGNRSKQLPKEDADDCAKPGEYKDAVTAMEGMGAEGDDDYELPVDAAKAMVFSSITAGVDLEAPTLEFAANSLEDESRKLDRAYDLRVKDGGGSGLHTMTPVLARVAVRDAKKTTCGIGLLLPGYESKKKECKNNIEGLSELADGRVLTSLHEVVDLADGYYTFTALALDKAGNKSDEKSRVAVHDTAKPVVTVAATTGSKAGDFDHNLVGTVTDALSIRDYSIAALVGVDGVYYGLESGLVDVDAYDADPTTPSASVAEAITLPFLGLQPSTGDPVKVTMLRVSVRDQAAGTDNDEDDVTIADLGASTTLDFEVTRDDDEEASTLEIKALVTSEANPFESVLFYAAADDNSPLLGDINDRRFIASVSERSARDNGGIWTYTARVSADDFYAAVGGDDSYSGKVYAVGVRKAGSVAGSGVVTGTVTTTTTNEDTDHTYPDQQRVVTRDADDNVTSIVTTYRGDAVNFSVGLDDNVGEDGVDGDGILNNDVGGDDDRAFPGGLNVAQAVVAEVEIITLATDDGGTPGTTTDAAKGDDVITRTTVTEQTFITLTKAGVKGIGMADDPDTDDMDEESVDYVAAVPAEGTIQTITTTDIVISTPGGVLVEGTEDNAVGIAEVIPGRPVIGDEGDVTIAVYHYDGLVSEEVIATAGDVTTTIGKLSMAVKVVTSVPGESTKTGGVGLVVESNNPQVVKER